MLIPQGLRFAHALALALVFFVTKQDTRRYLKSRIRYLGSSVSPTRAIEQQPSNTMTPRPSSSLLTTSTSLNLAAADTIANGAIRAAQQDLKGGCKPVTVTVLDAHGSILVQKRMDNCPDGAYRKFSFAKARTCIHLQSSSRSMRQKYTGGTADSAKFTQAASMVSVMEGELIPVAGGVLIQDADGNTVGSVGVSGAAADEDEYCALAGVQALEQEHGETFQTVPPEHSCTTLQMN